MRGAEGRDGGQRETAAGRGRYGRAGAGAIAVRGLSWQPKGAEKKILENVTLTFEPGYIYGVIGPNGSGKSSLLRHLLGFLPVQEGSVCWAGKSVSDYKKKELARLVSFVPQQTQLDTDFTVYDVVLTGRNPWRRRFQGITGEDEEQVRRALAFTRCEAFSGQRFSSLSGGEAQRAVIARAIAQDTGWIILDEPVSSLDVRSQIELMERLQRLNRESGTSILLVMHDINLTAAYCDRVVMLKNGQVRYAGDRPEIMTCEKLEELYGIGFCKAEAKGRDLFCPEYL